MLNTGIKSPSVIHTFLNPMLHTFFLIKKTDLVKHVLEVSSRIDPGCNCITEEDEILHYTAWVDADHGTDATECRVLLVIVTNVSQRCTPGTREQHMYNWPRHNCNNNTSKPPAVTRHWYCMFIISLFKFFSLSECRLQCTSNLQLNTFKQQLSKRQLSSNTEQQGTNYELNHM